VGSGGPFGKGLTNGTQNQAASCPCRRATSLAAVYLEELGFIGAMVLLIPVRRAPVAPPRRWLAIEGSCSG